MSNLKWKLLGIYEDLYYYALGLPRLLFTWKDDANLTMLNFYYPLTASALTLILGSMK